MEYVDFVTCSFSFKNNPQTLTQFIQEMNKKDFISVNFLQFHWNYEDSSLESIDIIFINRRSPSYTIYSKKLPRFT